MIMFTKRRFVRFCSRCTSEFVIVCLKGVPRPNHKIVCPLCKIISRIRKSSNPLVVHRYVKELRTLVINDYELNGRKL